MPIPDISRPVRIDGKTLAVTPPTANVALATSPVPSGQVYRVRTLLACNTTGAAQVFNAWFTRGGVNHRLFTNVTIPVNSTFNGMSSNTAMYLEEGDQLKFMCGTASGITVTMSYEAITG